MKVHAAENDRGASGVEQKGDRRSDDQTFHDTVTPFAAIDDDGWNDIK